MTMLRLLDTLLLPVLVVNGTEKKAVAFTIFPVAMSIAIQG